jgi:homocysteine S-methyltransferase
MLLFDGAMGTYIAGRFNTGVERCECENLRHPERVLAVHSDYILAGAGAIKTNTFAANAEALGTSREDTVRVIAAGCGIARRAVEQSGGHASGGCAIYASIGPVCADGALPEYEFLIETFLEQGIDRFLLETYPDSETPIAVARIIKRLSPGARVVAECACLPSGYTRRGESAQSVCDALSAEAAVDVWGLNCACGPTHMLEILRGLRLSGKPFCAMPNAGYPDVVNERTVFDASPGYFAHKLAAIADLGAWAVGGCCGTTPEHIRSAAEELRQSRIPQKLGPPKVQPHEAANTNVAAAGRLKPGFIAVELDSPANADLEPFMSRARRIAKAGADMLTIADCPVGRARLDSSMLAALVKQRLGIEAMPHLTCRDRNLNATQALLLGLNASDVTNILVVTGDPLPDERRSEIKSVFNFNAVKLAGFVSELNRTVFSAKPFTIMAALNVNAVNFPAELAKARKKEAAGASVFLTQPVFSTEALDNLKSARANLKAEILAGIMPIVSYRNALYMNNEISGISIPEAVVESYRDLSREEAERLAVRISLENAGKAAAFCDGYYIITTLNRTGIVCQIIEGMKL